jgi:hypothetical protein
MGLLLPVAQSDPALWRLGPQHGGSGGDAVTRRQEWMSFNSVY